MLQPKPPSKKAQHNSWATVGRAILNVTMYLVGIVLAWTFIADFLANDGLDEARDIVARTWISSLR